MYKPIILLVIGFAMLRADEQPFLEKFADPATRVEVLGKLIPGTRDDYFHKSLHHQLAGEAEAFEQTMATWELAMKRDNDPVSDVGWEILKRRQTLLNFEADPEETAKELTRILGLTFDQTRPDAAASEALATELKAEQIDEAAFENEAGLRNTEPYAGYRGARLLRELDAVAEFPDQKVRWFLQNLPRADHPGVVDLVVRGREMENRVDYGEADLHSRLTADQHATLLERMPALLSNERFATTYLSKLLPGTEIDFARDREAHAAHLARCLEFTDRLPPALNSLKAHVLHHHLRLQAELGNHPEAEFLRYLALPRPKDGFFPEREIVNSPFIQLGAKFESATGCPPVGRETELISEYLMVLLADADAVEAYAPFIEADELKRIHARARLLAGGEPARWGAALSAAEMRELQERSEILFTRSVPNFLNSDAEVSLPVRLKNTPELLIRIFELDLPAQLARTGRQPGVEIDLEGLVPHHERRIEFPQQPIVRHLESIALPELAGPGTWVVELVSGRDSARALIRKGALTPYIERTANGQIVRVFNEAGQAVGDAAVALGALRFPADESGRIFIPNEANRPALRGSVVAGKLAAAVELGSREDSLALDVRFHLDREQLIAGETAEAQLRLRLTNHGHEIPLDQLQLAALVLKAELLGGVTTERVIDDDLEISPTLQVPFLVPADLISLTLTLRGTVTPATGGDPLKLEASANMSLNNDSTTSRIGGAYFSADSEGHFLSIRGRNGEPLASRAVKLSITHEGYSAARSIDLRSDENGMIKLGALNGILSVTASGTDISQTTYKPALRELELPERLHISTETEIRLPLENPAAGVDRTRISLLEIRGNQIVRDHFDALSAEDGQLVIAPLPAGDFRLMQDNKVTTLLVSRGTRQGSLLVSGTRILPVHQPATPSFAELRSDNEQVSVRLRNHGPETRVTAIGSRYRHNDWQAGKAIHPFARPISPILSPAYQGNGYVTGSRLSDEVRYILDRRASRTFPGSLLPRPGLLLHRWTDEELDQDSVLGELPELGEPAPMLKREGSTMDPSGSGRDRPSGGISSSHAIVDFLGFKSAIRFDLTPDADGLLSLPLADFEGSQIITLIASDAHGSETLVLPLPASATPLRERRIARPLDPDEHFIATRRAAALAKGAEAEIENLLDADWRAFTTLGEAYQFLYGSTGDERLREMSFITEWPEFDEAKKLDLLAKHHCHELHLFLARKDPGFFEAHVRPLLEQKPEPQFMDELLLERDLTSYLRPFAWARLNAAEKALLARALPDARSRIAEDLAQRWELEAPSPEQETMLFAETLRGSDLATIDSLGLARKELRDEADFMAASSSGGVQYLTEKLRRIIIPNIDFEDTTVEEAVDFLRMRAMELDSLELDPGRKGLNINIRRPRGADPSEGGLLGGDPGSIRIPELKLRNVPMGVALKYITEATRLRYRVDDFGITLVPATELGEDLFTRSFNVPKDLPQTLAPNGWQNQNITDILRMTGISFGEGASAALVRNSLLVTNTPTELDKIEQLIDLAMDGDYDHIQETADPFGPAAAADPFAEGAAEADPFADVAQQPRLMARPPRPKAPVFPDSTRLWRESNYYRERGPAQPELVPLNRFWVDLAQWNGEMPFLSPHFNACTTNANEALLCLAVLDLPFKAERPEVAVDGNTLRVKAREPMLLFYKDTRRTDQIAPESPLLVRQSFHPLAEPFRTENGRKNENPVTGVFQTGVPYGASLVVTNPTGIGRRIEVLAQIPAGAIPLGGRMATLSSAQELEPHGVITLDLAFYFPAAGEFSVYPLHVSEDGVVLANSETRTLVVSSEAAAPDASSWLVVARDGSNEEVLARLETDNLHKLSLAAIQWRMMDPEFYQAASAILRQRLHSHPQVAAYALHHNDREALPEYLETTPLARQLGAWLDSPLLTIRPRIHLDWETLEFDPLVNPRAHDFAGKPRFTHEQARDHYLDFLRQLAWKPALSAADRLSLTAFLFLQDRTEEALASFDLIAPDELGDRLRYDYLKAISLFHRENAADARALAAEKLPSLPPGLWRDRFEAVVDQADEIAALAQPAPDDAPENVTPPAPSIELALASTGELMLRHSGMENASLSLFSIDLEILFSKDPFLQGEDKHGSAPAIRANEIRQVELDANAAETTIEIPEAFRNGSVLVSAESAGQRLLKVLDSPALEIRHYPEERCVQVFDSESALPLTKTYIKVYAESTGGKVVFHKDGYTDLRGKFDYISHTGSPVDDIRRFAVFISHTEKGSRIVIYPR